MKRVLLAPVRHSFRFAFLLLLILGCQTVAGGVSVIWITIDDLTPTELLISDRAGNCTGVDAHTGDSCREIPNSVYFSEYIESPDESGGMGSKQIEIMQPTGSEYTLKVTAAEEGFYELGIYCQDADGEPFTGSFDRVPISTGDVHVYTIVIDKASSATSAITGGFGGDGGEPYHINRLLSYVNISKAKTKFPTGTDSTDLFLLYGDEIVPETFTATLNGSDVSNLFAPKAGGYGIISIPLVTGENALVLSVSGADTHDDDSLVFVIE